MNILLIEDEDSIASFMAKGLAIEGHEVTRVATAASGVEQALSHDFQLVLLDLMLPDAPGSKVLARIKATKPDLPVIIVSALGEVDDKVTLLDMGADDYLIKPFAFAELAARVRTAARHGLSSTRVLTAGDLTLDVRTRMATRDGGIRAELPNREFSLLEFLMQNKGQPSTRQQLVEAVWGVDFESDSNVVDVYVSYLRRKLDRPGEPSVIRTVRGTGYQIRA